MPKFQNISHSCTERLHLHRAYYQRQRNSCLTISYIVYDVKQSSTSHCTFCIKYIYGMSRHTAKTLWQRRVYRYRGVGHEKIIWQQSAAGSIYAFAYIYETFTWHRRRRRCRAAIATQRSTFSRIEGNKGWNGVRCGGGGSCFPVYILYTLYTIFYVIERESIYSFYTYMYVMLYIKPKLRVCVLCLCVHMRVSEAGRIEYAIWGMRELLCTCAVSLVVAVLSLQYILNLYMYIWECAFSKEKFLYTNRNFERRFLVRIAYVCIVPATKNWVRNESICVELYFYCRCTHTHQNILRAAHFSSAAAVRDVVTRANCLILIKIKLILFFKKMLHFII